MKENITYPSIISFILLYFLYIIYTKIKFFIKYYFYVKKIRKNLFFSLPLWKKKSRFLWPYILVILVFSAFFFSGKSLNFEQETPLSILAITWALSYFYFFWNFWRQENGLVFLFHEIKQCFIVDSGFILLFLGLFIKSRESNILSNIAFQLGPFIILGLFFYLMLLKFKILKNKEIFCRERINNNSIFIQDILYVSLWYGFWHTYCDYFGYQFGLYHIFILFLLFDSVSLWNISKKIEDIGSSLPLKIYFPLVFYLFLALGGI